MGIQVEFNPDLALRNISEHKLNNKELDECIPEHLEENKTYSFLKKGQRNYWLEGELPLLETKGNQELSRPLASIKIVEAIHFLKNNEPHTKGKYFVVKVFDKKSETIHFESYKRVK